MLIRPHADTRTHRRIPTEQNMPKDGEDLSSPGSVRSPSLQSEGNTGRTASDRSGTGIAVRVSILSAKNQGYRRKGEIKVDLLPTSESQDQQPFSLGSHSAENQKM